MSAFGFKMKIPTRGITISLWDNGKKVTVKVYKADENFVTVTMPDKKMWTMTTTDFWKKTSEEWA